MGITQDIHKLLKSQEYMTAGRLLDLEISKNKSNHYLWYLRGVVSLNANNYPNSLECFSRALNLKKEYEYFRLKGMTYFQIFEFEEAIIEFENALKIKKNSEIYFYLSLCYMFLDDPISKDYLETAYLKNKKKTKILLKSFYNSILKNSWELNKKQKDELEKLFELLK